MAFSDRRTKVIPRDLRRMAKKTQSLDRPYVVCHMVTSIDGKILPDRWEGMLSAGRGAGGVFERTASSFGIGAWLVGTTTIKEFAGKNLRLRSAKEAVPPGDFVAKPGAKTLAIGVDAKAALRFQESEVDGDHVVVLTTEQAGDDYRAHLREAGVSYLICGKTSVDLKTALRKLRQAFGLKKLMLQGGGGFNGSMLQAGLVDEISLVIMPIADGGGAQVTGVFDPPSGPKKKAASALRVMSHRALPGGLHWFRYKVEGNGR